MYFQERQLTGPVFLRDCSDLKAAAMFIGWFVFQGALQQWAPGTLTPGTDLEDGLLDVPDEWSQFLHHQSSCGIWAAFERHLSCVRGLMSWVH